MKEGSGGVVTSHQPLRRSSYIDLPTYLERKQANINIKNDNKCFQWSILSARHPVRVRPERVGHYRPYEGELDFDDIEFSVTSVVQSPQWSRGQHI